MSGETKTPNNKKTPLNTNLPPLPDSTLKPGIFVRTAIENLSAANYVFEDKVLQDLLSEDSMHTIVGMSRHMPFFKLYDPTDKKGYLINGAARFYSKPIEFGGVFVYLNSQIYEKDREPFIKWYKKLQ